MLVCFLFLLATSLGSLSTLFWIPEDDLGRGYFQMNALVVLGLLGLAAAVAALYPPLPAPWEGRGVALGLAVLTGFLYHAAIWRRRWLLGRWSAGIAAAATLAALVISGAAIAGPPAVALPHRDLLVVAALISSALLLGWSLITMLLGHWYLVAPRLTFRHLTGFCAVLVALVALRSIVVGLAVAAAASVAAAAEPHPLRLLTSFSGQGMFFWFRLLWGLAVPMSLSLMALHCARRRSNQSATGILYVLVVGTFIGEVTGYYLAVTTGVPV